MGPNNGVVFIGLERTDVSVKIDDAITVPSFDEGTIAHPFSYKAKAAAAAAEASKLEPTVKTRRTRKTKTKEEELNVTGSESGPAEQGRRRGGRGRTRRQVDGPGSVG
jgi:hypothetical protein